MVYIAHVLSFFFLYLEAFTISSVNVECISRLFDVYCFTPLQFHHDIFLYHLSKFSYLGKEYDVKGLLITYLVLVLLSHSLSTRLLSSVP